VKKAPFCAVVTKKNKRNGKNIMNIKLLDKANELIKSFEYASFGVIDENGYPSASAIILCNPKNISGLYFITTMDSNKAKRLQGNNRASINCYTTDNNLTLVGEAEIITDQEAKNEHWNKWIEQGVDIYADGVTDPNYCFIRFITKRVSLWIDDEGAEFMFD